MIRIIINTSEEGIEPPILTETRFIGPVAVTFGYFSQFIYLYNRELNPGLVHDYMRSIQLSYYRDVFCLGVEPRYTTLGGAAICPFELTEQVYAGGFDPPKHYALDLKSSPFDQTREHIHIL